MTPQLMVPIPDEVLPDECGDWRAPDSPGAMSQWLKTSEAVFALELSPEGVVLARNRAAEQLFAAAPEGSVIWGALLNQDGAMLQERLASGKWGVPAVVSVGNGRLD